LTYETWIDAKEKIINLPDEFRAGLFPGDGSMALGDQQFIYWFTGSAALEARVGPRQDWHAPSGERPVSDRIRDALGLVHRRENELMTVLFFPSALLKDRSYRPTIAEAKAHTRFVARADGKHDRTSGRAGQTVDLYRLQLGDADLNGLPEVISVGVSYASYEGLSEKGQFEFEILDPLAESRIDAKSDEKFKDHLMAPGWRPPYTTPELRAHVLAI
jgi:hypothetical protein